MLEKSKKFHLLDWSVSLVSGEISTKLSSSPASPLMYATRGWSLMILWFGYIISEWSVLHTMTWKKDPFSYLNIKEYPHLTAQSSTNVCHPLSSQTRPSSFFISTLHIVPVGTWRQAYGGKSFPCNCTNDLGISYNITRTRASNLDVESLISFINIYYFLK